MAEHQHVSCECQCHGRHFVEVARNAIEEVDGSCIYILWAAECTCWCFLHLPCYESLLDYQ